MPDGSRGLATIVLALLAPLARADADLVRVEIDARYRIETVSQAGFEDDAIASTLRTRLGLQSARWHGFDAYARIEDVHAVGGDRFNSTANSRSDLPVVADPEDTELDQAWIAWAPGPAAIKAGRQRINLDNQRFIGAVGFRQNEQTFDGATATAAFGAAGTAFYGYLANANRVFGEHHPDPARSDQHLRAHLANYSAALGPVKGAVYGYFLKTPSTPAASHRDVGARLTGEPQVGTSGWRIPFAAEIAKQSPWADAPSSVNAHYLLGELGARFRDTTAKLGYEVLSGDGTYGFQTPLATLHAFNGWADRFLTTPPDGLRDRYAQLAQTIGPVEAAMIFHDFRADHGGQRYGREWNAALGGRICRSLAAKIEYADYRARAFGADTRILWFTLQASWQGGF